jgi:5-carboxymethyl-2-hydroxymuconate isomerase
MGETRGMSKKDCLAESHPALAAEALFDATKVTAGSHKKEMWRCSEGHEWEASIGNRVKGRGCPFCSGRRVISGVNDLATRYPELAKEALFDATKVMPGSSKKGMWRCAKGHEWEATMNSRTQGHGCPFCSGRRVLPGFNDLATTNPRLAAEALFDATKVTAGSHAKEMWRCTEGHEWEAVISSRLAGNGCTICSGQRVLPGFNDLATTHPTLAAEALFDATKVTAGSGSKEMWQCAQGHEWEASIASRSAGHGCPFCSGRRVTPGIDDLATTHPLVAAEALFDATKVKAFSNTTRRWRCTDGHEWEARISHRAKGSGCPACSGRQVLAGFNDLATTNPRLAAEALFDATKVTAGSHTKGMWRCAEGHEWEAMISGRLRGSGCPYCSGNRVLPGFNDLETTHPVLAAEALFDATKVTAGSDTKGMWRCDEGHEWEASIGNRSRGAGCPNCAESGFRPEHQAWLYLMHHDRWEMLQIGITNNPAIRERQHRRDGWSLVDIRGPMDGVLTRALERDILRFLKDELNVTLSTSRRSQYEGTPGRRGEAWLVGQYQPESLSDLVNATIEWTEMRKPSDGGPKGN